MLVKSAEEPCFSMTIQGTVNAKITEEKSKGAPKKGRKRFALSSRTKIRQGTVLCLNGNNYGGVTAAPASLALKGGGPR